MKGVFHGWVVVGAVFFALFLLFGVAYSFSAFFGAFEREFGASRGEIALVFGLCGFLYFTVGAFAGVLSDRIGPSRVVAAGFVFLAAGLATASVAGSLPMLYVTYSLGVGLGVGCAYVPAIAAVQPWFVRHRGTASGIASAGVGTGTLLVPVLAVPLIDSLGWRQVFQMFALIALVCGVAAAMLIDNSPARRGLGPDGDAPAAPAKGAPGGAASVGGLSIREALRGRPFWLIYVACGAFSVGLFIPFVHLAPFARDHGLSEQTGVFLMGLIGVGSVAGRFALAGVGDRLPRRHLLALVYALSGLLFVLWWASAQWPAALALLLAVFALAFGTCYGLFVALHPPLAMDYFGARNVSGLLGLLYTSAALSNLVGPTFAGYAFDASGSYSMPIAVSAGLMVLAFACALALRAPAGR